jgi:hypothetical protein
MNNFEKDEKAKQYEDTMTPYSLARRIIELEESQNKIKAEAVREARISCSYDDIGNDCFDGEIKVCLSKDLDEHANKLERGEL